MIDDRTQAYERIRRKLLDGSVQSPRDLSRRRLAASLNVNPGHVQWALNRMEAEGLLESRPQSGTFIRRLTPQQFRNLYDIRKLIEPFAAARAARLITPDLLARLDRSIEQMAEIAESLEQLSDECVPAEVIERVIHAEIDFHGTILEAAQNPEAARIVEHTQIFFHLMRYVPEVSREVLRQDVQSTMVGHRDILEAIRHGNAKVARRRMKAHVSSGLTTLRQQEKSQDE